jgi:hypothetical protein
MTACPRVPAGLTLDEARAQRAKWQRTGERIQALLDEARAERAAPEVLLQAARYLRASARESMKWDSIVRAMRVES